VKHPESIDPVNFELVEEEFQQVARPRIVLRIIVEHGTDEEIGAAIAQSLREGLDEHSKAKVGVVWAYFEGDDTENFYTAGIGTASVDGKGWTGDGALLMVMPQDQEDEDGKIFIVVGSALDDEGERAEFIFPADDPDGDD
jgi:hypothetical protein